MLLVIFCFLNETKQIVEIGCLPLEYPVAAGRACGHHRSRCEEGNSNVMGFSGQGILYTGGDVGANGQVLMKQGGVPRQHSWQSWHYIQCSNLTQMIDSVGPNCAGP